MNLYNHPKVNFVKKTLKSQSGCLIIFILFALTLIACGKEEKQTYYATLQEARQNSVFESWLPVMPLSAVNINEKHFIDLNYVWLKFLMNPNEVPNFSARLTKLSLDEVRALGKKIWGEPKWWPKLLTANKIKNAKEPFPFVVARYNYEFDYGHGKKQNMHGYFFINTQSGETCYIGGYEN